MDKVYKHQDIEKKWYKVWENGGYFTPETNLRKKPLSAGRQAFTIIMPPPNANGSLHIGHAMFLTLEDIMIRYHRMIGDPTLWLPGADHAGILTQVVFEKKLEKEEGKTRYYLGREEFFKRCMEFTLANKRMMENQMRAIGASCDWTRVCFTLDPKFNKPIYSTFKRLYNDNLLYRAERMINWCPRCSTALSDLEVIHKERKDSLYYIKYGPFVLATVRPETKFGDTAIAVHPKDKRYQKWIGKVIEAQGLLGKFKIKVIADKEVNPKFGTGAVKVTPAHDPVDFEIGQRHNLEVKQVIDFSGRLNKKTGKYQGLTVKEARKIITQDLKRAGLLEKINPNYVHAIATCERCKTTIEPMISLQWFIKTKSLAEKAIEAVKKGKIKIIPKRFEKSFFFWMENIKDWCISRQLWWGHQIPVWYCGIKQLSKLQLAMNHKLRKEKGTGCGRIIVDINPPTKCSNCGNSHLIQDPDTLDTWFSSGQWPYTTLGFGQTSNNPITQSVNNPINSNKNSNKSSSEGLKDTSEVPPLAGRGVLIRQLAEKDSSEVNGSATDFEYFYPTSVMETGYEILFFWVARMIMLGLYATGKEPFKTVYLHGLVRDAFGEKMSKSKGNIINPLDIIAQYGTDSLRMALVFGTSPGTDVKLGEKKVEAMRNFSNKLWNIGRFLKINIDQLQQKGIKVSEFDGKINRNKLLSEDKKVLTQLEMLTRGVTKEIDNFQFAKAAERLYKFIWHEFADKYIEKSKARLRQNDATVLSILLHTYTTCLKLLHPFMPFITEEIASKIGFKKITPLIITSWPSA